MFERPIRLGDHVAIAGYEGDVIDIGMRATSLRTAPGSVVIVPNQSLITGNVVNWDSGVSGAAAMQWRMSGSVDDSESLVKNLLESHPGVLKLPAPSIYIVAADHAGHVVEAHFNVAGGARNRLKIISDLNRRVLTELERCGRHLAPNP
jgi:small-conductance mechanosensitive channel